MNSKIPFWRSIRFMYTVVLAVGIVFFVGLAIFTRADRCQQNQMIFESRKQERQTNFDIVMRLDSQSLKDITNENTYWDDMVNFINDPTEKFETDVLRSQINSYKAQAIWTYNERGNLVSNTNNFAAVDSEITLGLSPQALTDIFAKDHEAHFFKETKVGLLEVFGSTVHPSTDEAHETKPLGYFFIARLLDDEYGQALAQDTSNQIEIVPASRANQQRTDYSADEGKVAFYKDLRDYNGSLAGQIYVNYDSTAISNLVRSFDRSMLITVAAYIILSTVFYIVIGRLLIHPLTQVYTALLKNSTKPLDNLESNHSEFGRIATLISTSFKQQDEIARAVTESRTAQEALEKRSQELEHTNRLMINRELRMIELKKEIAELKAAKPSKSGKTKRGKDEK